MILKFQVLAKHNKEVRCNSGAAPATVRLTKSSMPLSGANMRMEREESRMKPSQETYLKIKSREENMLLIMLPCKDLSHPHKTNSKRIILKSNLNVIINNLAIDGYFISGEIKQDFTKKVIL